MRFLAGHWQNASLILEDFSIDELSDAPALKDWKMLDHGRMVLDINELSEKT